MISIYKRGARYWVRGSFRGQPVRRHSLDTSDRQTAETARRALEDRMLRGEPEASRAPAWSPFTRELEASFRSIQPSTAQKYRFVLARFTRFLESRNLEILNKITPASVRAYCIERQADLHPTRKRPLSAEGIKSDLRILHRFFALAVQQGLIASNPVRGEKRSPAPGRTLPFTDAEIERLQRACRERDRRGAPLDLWPIVLFFITTGLRISDVVEFQKSALDLASRQIVVKTRKRGRVVSLPIHPALGTALTSWAQIATRAQKASPYLFPTASGLPMRSLDAYLGRLFKSAGIEHGHAHRFRDTFAVKVLQQGGTLYDVAKLLGISHAVAERHYTPYVAELQERGRRLVEAIRLPTIAATG